MSGPAELVALPNRWQRIQLRHVATIQNGADYKHIEVSDGGYPVYGSGGIFKRASDYLYDGESVLFGRKGTIDRPLHVSGRFWTVDTMFYTRLSERIVGRFLYYYATTMPYSYYSTSTALPSMTQGDLAGHAIPLPPLEEQWAIANFLDEQTSRIDTLIAKQNQLIDVLRERRVGVIAQALGHGLDSEPIQRSGLSWLADVPSSWHPLQIKNFGQVWLGKMLQSADTGGDVVAPYMRAANVQPDGALQTHDVKEMWFAPLEFRNLGLRSGDVVVVEGGVGGFGRAAYLKDDLDGWGFQNSILRIRPFAGNDGRFLAYAILLARENGYIRAYCNVVSMPHFTTEKVAAFRFWCPPGHEQTTIADHLDRQTMRIDALIAKTNEHIVLAKERRTALITAAVMGQIDVRIALQAGAA